MYEVLRSEKEVRDLIEWHNTNSEWAVIDLETTGLDSFKDSIVDVQITGRHSQSVCIFPGTFIRFLRELHNRPILHNGRFDIAFLHRKGCDVTHWQYHDTLLIAHLLDENRVSYSLDSLIKELFDDPYKEEFWAKYSSYQEAPEEARHEYGAKDILYTAELYRRQLALLQEQGIPQSLVAHVHRLQSALLKTEITGVKVDLDYLANLGSRLKSQIETIRPQMRELVQNEADLIELQLWNRELDKRKTLKGRANVTRPRFAFDSSKQLQTLLYDCLDLPEKYNEKTKAPSVDDSCLEQLKEHHPIVSLIQEYRGLNKVYGTYIEGTLERQRDGRIYPEFRCNGTKTGRISHSNPNLAQLPKTGGIRGIYVPDKGNVFISADFSQLEVCIEANLTEDRQLARIFTTGASKHDITAAELAVDRDTAKTLNFALQYWCTAKKVAKLLGVSEKEGQHVWNKYWEVYSGPKNLKDRTDRSVNEGKALVNLFGRLRRFERRERSAFDGDYRQAYNFLIQGTGADLTSRAFYLMAEWLEEKGIGRGLFTVHDELLIEVKSDYAHEAEAKMLSIMTRVGDEIGLKIPLKAESSGPMSRWED